MKRARSEEPPTSKQADGDSPQSQGDQQRERKSRRVRTGCLTCRGRHLKCDEGWPVCQNCQKSNRTCERGVKLNFITIKTMRPPILIPASDDWHLEFQDDSMEIASHYKGGRAKYLPLQKQKQSASSRISHINTRNLSQYGFSHHSAPSLIESGYSGFQEYAAPLPSTSTVESYHSLSHLVTANQYSEQPQLLPQSYPPSYSLHPHEPRPVASLNLSDEVTYMQTFVEEVAVWMDSMDEKKHFSRLLPFQALHQPILKNALLACGARHLAFINPNHSAENAAKYYNIALQMLRKMLASPNQDLALCATTATVLNVYENMYENDASIQRTGARALIMECGWDARSTGIAGACFWLNVGMELLSSLYLGWGIEWDPNTWNVDIVMDMNTTREQGNWAHLMLYLLAKVTNFRVSHETSRHQDQHQREQLWMILRDECDRWNANIPPMMHPIAVLEPYQSASKSPFAEIWILDRASIVARLFYHTAMTLLGTCHPRAPSDRSLALDMREMQLRHARRVCGIVAHCKDKYVYPQSRCWLCF